MASYGRTHKLHETAIDAALRAQWGNDVFVCPTIREAMRRGISAYLASVHREARDPHVEAIVLDRARTGFRALTEIEK